MENHKIRLSDLAQRHFWHLEMVREAIKKRLAQAEAMVSKKQTNQR